MATTKKSPVVATINAAFLTNVSALGQDVAQNDASRAELILAWEAEIDETMAAVETMADYKAVREAFIKGYTSVLAVTPDYARKVFTSLLPVGYVRPQSDEARRKAEARAKSGPKLPVAKTASVVPEAAPVVGTESAIASITKTLTALEAEIFQAFMAHEWRTVAHLALKAQRATETAGEVPTIDPEA